MCPARYAYIIQNLIFDKENVNSCKFIAAASPVLATFAESLRYE